MDMDTKIEKLGEGGYSASGTLSEVGTLGVQQRVANLEKQAQDVKSDFQRLEKDMDKFKNFAYVILSAMAIVFALTSVAIGFDYLKNNQNRYEEFIRKTEEIKSNFYTKRQADDIINFSVAQIENQLDDFKKCLLVEGGWSRCF